MGEPDHKGQSLMAIAGITHDNNLDTSIAQSKSWTDLSLAPTPTFTLTRARTVDRHTLTDEELTSADQVPNYILKTLMIANYHAREFQLKSFTSDKDKTKSYYDSDDKDNYNSDSDDDDDDKDDEGTVNDGKDDEGGVNPMDALLWIFHCSDDFLRRDLAIKLSACQLSVPFLLPDPAKPSENVTILLSALVDITKSWKNSLSDEKDSALQVFATEHPFPVVSFIRIGKPTMSKSSLLNKIMSDGSRDHNFFFHKDMKGGEIKRKVVDGLVELCWYLPGGCEKQALQNEICFSNLRGDALNFKKQRDLMLKISSVLCILLPSEYPDETMKNILKEATQSTASVIFIFNEKRQKESKIYFKDLKSKHHVKFSSITRANQPNEYNFLQRIREHIQKKVHEKMPKSLVQLVSYANKGGFRLDGKQPDSRLRKSVDTWPDTGIKEAKDLLKLQTHVPVLAELEREKYFPKRQSSKSKSDGTKRGVDEIYKDIEAEKKAQRESFKKMDKRILELLNCIAMMNETERNYALSKLKHRLDKKSMQVMVKLRNEYHVASLNIQKKRKEESEESVKQLEQNLKQLEKSITKCSFGFEHIIRELAELYQLSCESQYDYAGAAAEILLSGQPLELLDGDSSYIPLKWFEAVYSKLENKTGNAKLFVISVLGIQSSGKSTFLNTMFGLEFPVSAGRCTRGAFASLIPVGDSLKSASKFDYILIIDTEGLRGSGDPQLREHDNELATFAIGIADVTLVNIFGENQNEMKEFLEIAVHAFLKMKLVKEKKACKIVHQNVAATDAKNILTVERLNLKRDLDKMAKVAAIQENCEQEFQKLSDIMSFDENEDVFYIPSLLQGSPPMAPVNPEYGRAVQRVKEDIITLMCSKESSKLSVSDFRQRVMDLWKAMLKENFIFNFRNTIEVRAYTSLDRKYFKEFVNVMLAGMVECRRKVHLALRRCASRKERKKKWDKSKRDIREEAAELEKKMKTAMEDFFETGEYKATLERWRKDIMTKIEKMKEYQISEVTTNCSAVYDYLQNQQDVEENKKSFENKLLVKAKKLKISAHNTDKAEECLAVFDRKWEKWMIDVPLFQEDKEDVPSEMLIVLLETNLALSAEMTGKLEKQGDSILKFKEIAPKIDIDQLNVKWYTKAYNYVFRQQQQQEVLLTAKTIRDQAVEKALDFAKKTAKSGVRCTRSDLTQMYHKVITTIDEESEKSKIKFLDSLKCDILLHTFARACETFEKMEERYLQERNIRGDLERNLRPRLEAYFKNICNKMENEVLAATSFVDVLKEPIETELNRIMGPAVAKEFMNNNEFDSKGQFQASVLIQLGKEGKFESYIPYLENPIRFLKMKLKETIEIYCLEKKSASTVLEIEAEKLEKDVFAAVSTAHDETKSGGEKLTFWIQKFVQKCSSLGITKEMFNVVAIEDDLKDMEVFQAKVFEKLKDFFKSLIERGVDRATMEKWNPSPHEHLFPSIFGCQSCCPFCKGLCDKTNPDHPHLHSTKIHRPQGLTGYRNVNTKILIISICTDSVDSDRDFKNLDTSWKTVPYKDYQSVNDYYKSWSIHPDSSFEASTYWQWFMATFSKELVTHYEAKEPDIPSTWKKLTFEEVEDNLRKEYKIFEIDRRQTLLKKNVFLE